jgi:hypothetical protein
MRSTARRDRIAPVASPSWPKEIGRLFVPAPRSMVPLALGAIWAVGAGGCSALLLGADAAGLSFAGGLGVVPVAGALAFLGGILAKNACSRSAVFGLTTLVLAAGALFIALLDADKGLDVGAVTISIVLYGIPVVVTGMLTLFFGMRASKEIAERVEEVRADTLCRLLAERGEASFQELSEASGVPETIVDDVIEARVRAGKLGAVVDPSARMAFTATQFHSKEQQLAAVAHARGKAALYDVARELGLSEPRVRELLYAAMTHGRFAGYVDWVRGIVYSADARKLREGKQCPRCGGGLDLAGGGVLACPFCRTEILVA